MALTLVLTAATTAEAQRRSGFFEGLFGRFPTAPQTRAPSTEKPADWSRAPAPRKPEVAPSGSILVLGDSMADWLAFGLEDVLAETPELGVVRKHRTGSGLIRYEARGDAPDWAQVARDLIAAEKPKFVVMMLGLHDRQAIREQAPVRQAPDAQAATPQPPPRARPPAAHEYRSEKWAELYTRRIDDTIAALRSSGVPVFWVGLPPVRGARSTSDMLYLNELFRGRAEKAGIAFVDVWDGFVDDGGRFVLQGPDVEGQIRRLRTSDGVHFTNAGARKLAHYVDREIKRALDRGPVPVALPATEPQQQISGAMPDGPTPRPLAGPVIPLTSSIGSGNELAGGANGPDRTAHVTATRILVKGEASESPAGRGDDFAWPRRDIAPFGTDPVVATTTLPLPVMLPPPVRTVEAPTPAPAVAAVAPRRPSRPAADTPPQRRRTFAPFPFFPFFRF